MVGVSAGVGVSTGGHMVGVSAGGAVVGVSTIVGVSTGGHNNYGGCVSWSGR